MIIITVGVGKDFSTIAAARAAVADPRTDDVEIQVFSGEYEESVNNPADVDAGFRITYLVVAGEDVVWQTDGGSGICHGASNKITVRGFDVEATAGRMFFPSGDDWIIERNAASDTKSDNIFCQSGGGVDGLIIRNNSIPTCGGGLGTGDCIRLDDNTNTTITHNYFSQNSAFDQQCIHAFGASSSNLTIKRNVFRPFPIPNRNSAIKIDAATGVTGFDSDENVFVNQNRIGVGTTADAGVWLGVIQTTLADWRTASGGDAASVNKIALAACQIRPTNTITGSTVGTSDDIFGTTRIDFNSGPQDFGVVVADTTPPVFPGNTANLTVVDNGTDGDLVVTVGNTPTDAGGIRGFKIFFQTGNSEPFTAGFVKEVIDQPSSLIIHVNVNDLAVAVGVRAVDTAGNESENVDFVVATPTAPAVPTCTSFGLMRGI